MKRQFQPNCYLKCRNDSLLITEGLGCSPSEDHSMLLILSFTSVYLTSFRALIFTFLGVGLSLFSMVVYFPVVLEREIVHRPRL